MEWFENALRMFAPFATGLTPAKGGTAKAPRKDVELDELKRQLAAMQAQLAKLAKDD
jgi:polyhydroxyalkanoate synthesis regulator protein